MAAVMDGQADLTLLTWLPYLWLHETAGAAFWDVRELVAEIDGLTDINDIVKTLGPLSPEIPAESFVFGAGFPEDLRDAAAAALEAIAGPYPESDPPPPGFEAVNVLLPDHEGLAALDHSAYLGLLGLIDAAGMTVEEVFERYMH